MKISVKDYEIFHVLHTDEASEIEVNSTIAKYRKGAIIHLEEDYCDHLEIIAEGKVHVEQIDQEGNTLIIRSYEKGSCIGSNLLFASDNRYMLHVIADQDTTLLRVPKHSIEEHLSNSDFRSEFIRLISDNSLYFGKHIKYDFRQSLREKLMEFIISMIQEQQSFKILLPISKTGLARTFGVARTSLSRELQKMKQEGILEFDRKSIKLLNQEEYYEKIL